MTTKKAGTEQAVSNKALRLQYTLDVYEELTLDGAKWVDWPALAERAAVGLNSTEQLASTYINELCKQGHFEMRDAESGRQVKRRYDAPNIA